MLDTCTSCCVSLSAFYGFGVDFLFFNRRSVVAFGYAGQVTQICPDYADYTDLFRQDNRINRINFKGGLGVAIFREKA